MEISTTTVFPDQIVGEEAEDQLTDQKVNDDEVNKVNVDGVNLQHRWITYRGVSFYEAYLPVVMAAYEGFEAKPSDIFLVTYPKSGTTWLKAIIFSVADRKLHHPLSDDHPLIFFNPHELVPVLEMPTTAKNHASLADLPPPRLIHTHLPLQLLPEVVNGAEREDDQKNKEMKEDEERPEISYRIIYLCRDPKDIFVSMYSFLKTVELLQKDKKLPDETSQLEGLLRHFCSGGNYYGTFWDHVKVFWEKSLKEPHKVLFIKYEEMMKEPERHVSRIAEFMELPFSEEEVKNGVVEDIVKLCSFEKLSGLEVNNGGFIEDEKKMVQVSRASFFRNGKVGDWVNHLTPEMARRLDGITEEKLKGCGLVFDV